MKNDRGNGLFRLKLFPVMLVSALLSGSVSVALADEDCEARRRQLQRAEEILEEANRAQDEAINRFHQAEAAEDAAEEAYETERAKTQEAIEALDAAREAEAEARANTSALGKVFNTAEWQAYEAAAAELEYARGNLEHQRGFEARAHRTYLRASEARGETLLEALRAGRRVMNALRQWEEARRRAQEPCEEEKEEVPDVEQQTQDFLGDGGQQVLNRYRNQAREANTEDIAIDAESRGGVHGSTGGSTSVSGTVNCFGSLGDATVLFNGALVCTSTGGVASTGNAISASCTSGQPLSFTVACPGATPGPTCHLFVASLTGLTCGASLVGVQTNGPTTVNCTCN